MTITGMVQVAVHQIVGVIAVGNRRMAAIRTVRVSLFVTATVMIGRAAGGVRRVHGQAVFLDLTPV